MQQRADDAGEVQQLPLDKIGTLKGVQPRDSLDKHQIESLAAGYAAPDSWPPIVVIRVGDAYGIIDGHHRVKAALDVREEQLAENEQRAKSKPPQAPLPVLSTIAGRVLTAETGTQARMMAIEFNIKNGLPLPHKTRIELAERLKETVPGISNREIARRVGVHPSTIASVLARAKQSSPSAGASERYGIAAQVPAARKIVSYARAFVKENRSGLIFKSADSAEASAMRVKALIAEAQKADKPEEVTAGFLYLIEALTQAVEVLRVPPKAASNGNTGKGDKTAKRVPIQA